MVTISLCMIVKNEEYVLGRCLECVKNIVDEIIKKLSTKGYCQQF